MDSSEDARTSSRQSHGPRAQTLASCPHSRGERGPNPCAFVVWHQLTLLLTSA